MGKNGLGNLEPNRVFHYFEEIADIPRGSGNTKAISEYLLSFAKERGLEWHQDEYNNVIIIKKAHPECEQKQPIILQSHIDMVCEKDDDCKKDMSMEGIDLYVDGDELRAMGTTLGGDDGIGVAMTLAILEDDDLKAPRVEAVFTSDEEIGMIGASAIDVSLLKGRKLLNIDSEKEGIFTVSCAGGVLAKCGVHVEREEECEGTYLKLNVAGLIGGHSGLEINKRRANANRVLGDLLNFINDKLQFKIVSLKGGVKDNAIPVSAEAIICVDDSNVVVNRIGQLVVEFRELVKQKYINTDPDLTIEYDFAEKEEYPECYDKVSSENILEAFVMLPEGIKSMSTDINGLVQTSLNCGTIECSDDEVVFGFCVRSSVESEKKILVDKLEECMKGIHGYVILSGDYPAWEFNKESEIRDLICYQYEDMFGKKAVIESVHAGVECGIFAAKIPGLDCVSYGPELTDIHTSREAMSIPSVKRVYELTRKVLESI